MTRFVLFALCMGFFNLPLIAGKVVLFNEPADAPRSDSYQVVANKQTAFVHRAPKADFVNFNFEGSIELRVTSTQAIQSVVIRPLDARVHYKIKGNEIRFTLSKPGQYSVEINNDLTRPLLVFANAPETNAPKPGDANVKYFEAGKIHEVGFIELRAEETVYIEGGAIVRGCIYTDGASNSKVLGRGILDGMRYKKGETRMIELNRVSNVLIEGIVITDSKHWTMPIFKSKNVRINNVKIINGNDWDDGVDIVGSQHITLQNSFIRTKDDCVAIKSGVSYFTRFKNEENVKHITVENCVLWNAEWGNAVEIGYELRCDTVSDVTFRNLDIIHVQGPNDYHEGCFTIHNGDRAVVSNVLYQNIRVENPNGFLLIFKIDKTQYTKDAQRGKIENIRFENISVNMPTPALPSVLHGFDETYNINGVSFKNLRFNNQPILSTKEAKFDLKNAENIRFE